MGGDSEGVIPLPGYVNRLEVLRRLTEGGKRLRAVVTETLGDIAAVTAQYADHVSGGKAEGLVVRAPNTNVFKVKPVIHIDAVVIGFTNKVEDAGQARSLLLALMREDGAFQIIGSVGNMGDEESRRMVLRRVEPLKTESSYRHASRDGALYRMVRPEVVVQFRVNDVQSSDPHGAPVKRMVLRSSDAGWSATARMPGVAIYHPIFEGFRDDKRVDPVDLRMQQVLDACYVSDVEAPAQAVELPKSSLLARRVFTKVAKDVMSVRKILAWRTNKEQVDPRFPAYVVHYTDYSPTRKMPLQRTVRCAPTLDAAIAQVDAVLAYRNVLKDGKLSRGWEESEDRRLDFGDAPQF